MKHPGFFKIVFAMLLGTIILQSCDMSKYYFRMHPGRESHQPKNAVPREIVSESFKVSEETVIRQVDSDSAVESIAADSPFPPNESVVPEPAVQQSTDTQVASVNESDEQVSSVKAKKQRETPRTSGDESVIMIFALILAFMVGICLLVFLVAWIFAPALVALRIALWTFAGISLLVLIGVIRAITIS